MPEGISELARVFTSTGVYGLFIFAGAVAVAVLYRCLRDILDP